MTRDVTALSDSELLAEHATMHEHEEGDVLTDEQEQYLADLREEMLKRMSTGGPHADYTGPEGEGE